MSAEEIKKNSNSLRGTIAEALASGGSHFSDIDERIIKFHGIYQQDLRDERIARMRAKEEPAYVLMVRTKIPGGNLSAEQYLALDHLTRTLGNGTLRITTRQDIQFHGILKANLKKLIAGINAARIITWGGCGDVERNVCATPAPMNTPVHREVQRLALEISNAFIPRSRAYFEIWLDGKKLSTEEFDEKDQLYGDAYLPRKFKTAIVIPPRNDVDIYTHDLGFVPHFPNGEIEGYTVLAGGGQGMDHAKEATFPFLSQPLFYVRKEHVLTAARTIITMFRDFGDRTNRKHARLKYVIADKGIEWFRNEAKARLGAPTEDPKPLSFTTVADALGWNEQGDGKYYCGVKVENGRIKDDGQVRFASAFRAIAERFKCQIRLTNNENILFCNLAHDDRPKIDAILKDYGIPGAETYSAARSMSISCVALPTCGLALSESERVFPKLMDQIDVVLKELGLESEPILFRMTGCPNGCARPYNTDFGFVGRGIGKYAMYVGGSHTGDRMSGLAFKSVAIEKIPAAVRGFLVEFVEKRKPSESFSAYWGRTQTNGPSPHSSQFHVELAERAKRLAAKAAM